MPGQTTDCLPVHRPFRLSSFKVSSFAKYSEASLVVPYYVLTVLFGELLLLSLELVVLVLVLLPAPVERPLHVALRAAEVRLEEPVHRKEDDAVQVLHLQGKEGKRGVSQARDDSQLGLQIPTVPLTPNQPMK